MNRSASSAPRASSVSEERLQYARVLVELGDLDDAEREIDRTLDDDPDDLTSLNLLSKIKHMKGELSEAIACWAQLHARSPHNELAIMCLSALLQMAKDPARGAGEYVALGQLRTGRRPAVHVELESAFGLLLAGRAEEARATCERIATKYKSRDRDAYKLAVMASAWIAELTGEFAAACRILEALGEGRGFETDADRVLSLARIYERIGTRETLEKAVHVFRYLDRSFEKMSAQSHLASVYRKLGDEPRAREYEQRFTESFQRRMHRVSIMDVGEVAARRFFPLDRLRRIHTVAYTDQEAPASERARAIVRAIEGDVAEARASLERSNAPLDRKYIASLELLAGNAHEAARLFVAASAGGAVEADDPRALEALLAIEGADDIVRPYFQRSEVFAAALEYVETALRASPHRASLWRALASLRRIAGETAEAARCSDRAAALDEAARRDASAIGRVLAAAVYHFVGKAKGLIHQIWVDRKPVPPGRGGFLHPDDILGNVTAEMRQATRNTFVAVREYARSRFPDRTANVLDYDYTYKVTKDDETSGGTSAGLPTALAFLSVFLQRAVPQDVAFSGVIVAEAHDVLVVRHVGEVEFKVKAAYNRNLRRLLLPRDNRVDVESNSQVPRTIAAELVRYVPNLNEAVTETWGEDIWTR
jgi:tetratricopeptide (TPR) repeat protein